MELLLLIALVWACMMAYTLSIITRNRVKEVTTLKWREDGIWRESALWPVYWFGRLMDWLKRVF